MRNLKYMMAAVLVAMIATVAFAAQDSTLTEKELRDPKQLEPWLEANAADAESRIATIEAGTISGDLNVGADFTVSTNAEITAASSEVSANQKAVITIEDYAMVMTESSGSDCHGTIKIADFPEGYIEVTGIHCDLEMVNTQSGVAADTQYDVGFGSTETDGTAGALDTSTDYDWLGKIEGDLSSYEADIESQSITDVGVDGTATANDMWLNVAYLDADVTGETTNTINGTVTFYWRNLGDD